MWISATLVATNAAIVPSLGRDLAAGPRGTASIPLIEPFTAYGPNWLRPTQVLGARLVKFGAQVDW